MYEIKTRLILRLIYVFLTSNLRLGMDIGETKQMRILSRKFSSMTVSKCEIEKFHVDDK